MQALRGPATRNSLFRSDPSRRRTLPPTEERAFCGFMGQLRLTVSIAKTDAIQESSRVVGPQAGDVAHLARYSTQHRRTFASARAPEVLVLQGFNAVNEFSSPTARHQAAIRRRAAKIGFHAGHSISHSSPSKAGSTAMDLSFSDQEEAFRREVRQWLKRNVPKRQRKAEPAEFGDPKRIAELRAWQRRLYGAGYLAMGWPKQYGGRAEPGADPRETLMRQTIVAEELLKARAPSVIG